MKNLHFYLLVAVLGVGCNITRKKNAYSTNSGFAKIDDALGRYYKELGNENYYNSEGEGKFMHFVRKYEYDEAEISDELSDGNLEDCGYLEFDVEFPFKSKINTKEEEMFDILKKAHLYGKITNTSDTESDNRKISNCSITEKKNAYSTNSGFAKIDDALGRYYKELGNENYYNSEGEGKFMHFVRKYEYDEAEISDELADGNLEDCSYLEFDDEFPFEYEINTKEEEQEKMFDILKKAYEHGKIEISPINQLNNSKSIITAYTDMQNHTKKTLKLAKKSSENLEHIYNGGKIEGVGLVSVNKQGSIVVENPEGVFVYAVLDCIKQNHKLSWSIKKIELSLDGQKLKIETHLGSKIVDFDNTNLKLTSMLSLLFSQTLSLVCKNRLPKTKLSLIADKQTIMFTKGDPNLKGPPMNLHAITRVGDTLHMHRICNDRKYDMDTSHFSITINNPNSQLLKIERETTRDHRLSNDGYITILGCKYSKSTTKDIIEVLTLTNTFDMMKKAVNANNMAEYDEDDTKSTEAVNKFILAKVDFKNTTLTHAFSNNAEIYKTIKEDSYYMIVDTKNKKMYVASSSFITDKARSNNTQLNNILSKNQNLDLLKNKSLKYEHIKSFISMVNEQENNSNLYIVDLGRDSINAKNKGMKGMKDLAQYLTNEVDSYYNNIISTIYNTNNTIIDEQVDSYYTCARNNIINTIFNPNNTIIDEQLMPPEINERLIYAIESQKHMKKYIEESIAKDKMTE